VYIKIWRCCASLEIKMSSINKVFWKNFLLYFLLFGVIWFILSWIPYDSSDVNSPTYFDPMNGYLFASSLAVLILGVQLALRFYRGEKIDEYIKRHNLDRRKFYEENEELLDILD